MRSAAHAPHCLEHLDVDAVLDERPCGIESRESSANDHDFGHAVEQCKPDALGAIRSYSG